MPAGDPHDRVDAEMLEGGGEQHGRVQAGADLVFEDVAGGADLLAIAPRGRWLGIEDAIVVDGRADGLDDGIDAPGGHVADGERPRAGRALEQRRGPPDERSERRMVGLDECREQLERQQRGVRVDDPLAGGQHPDGGVSPADGLAFGGHRHREVAMGGLVEPGHGRGVELQRRIVEDDLLSGVEAFDVVRPRLGEGVALVIDEPGRDLHVPQRRRRRLGGQAEGDPVQHADSVVRHSVIDDGSDDALDPRRRHGRQPNGGA